MNKDQIEQLIKAVSSNGYSCDSVKSLIGWLQDAQTMCEIINKFAQTDKGFFIDFIGSRNQNIMDEVSSILDSIIGNLEN